MSPSFFVLTKELSFGKKFFATISSRIASGSPIR